MSHALPEGLEIARTTPEFDETTVPAGLLSSHRIADGVWGRLVVTEGSLGFVFEADAGGQIDVSEGRSLVIPPAEPHHLVLVGSVCFHVEFHRPPR